jgi:hypothetical protein
MGKNVWNFRKEGRLNERRKIKFSRRMG